MGVVEAKGWTCVGGRGVFCVAVDLRDVGKALPKTAIKRRPQWEGKQKKRRRSDIPGGGWLMRSFLHKHWGGTTPRSDQKREELGAAQTKIRKITSATEF